MEENIFYFVLGCLFITILDFFKIIYAKKSNYDCSKCKVNYDCMGSYCYFK